MFKLLKRSKVDYFICDRHLERSLGSSLIFFCQANNAASLFPSSSHVDEPFDHITRELNQQDI
ncbi:MAG: hypothetical protein RMZ41_023930 [Nostoc sp. DedVER02]|uniref:hypothetical protein n=1 Tax=unclassified Nostoc TaxID=2593658 RepID=UPI002AD2A073|nr:MULTISPECIES: hypothetical protein [unclassified Nostoc]MDZ7990535.1 hypothetical protein [Nostoc sp. DedVER02]MDZ8113893.1 hypothetical protein [Nostoc sp. DedVER01b]